MPYAWNGTCYETPEKALDGFALDVPRSDGGGLVAFTQAPTIDGVGLITWSIAHRPLNDDAATVRTGTTQLQSCVYESLGPGSVVDVVFICAMVFSFFVGFRSGQAA